MRPVLTGTEVYARRIIEELAALRAERMLRVYANAVDLPPWLPAGVQWRGIPFPRAWTHWRFRQTLRRDRPDVVFIPSHVLPLALGLPSVVTIHDVGHRHHPGSYSRTAWWYLELTTRYAARRATRLIAVSQSTADDLRRFYGVDRQRLTVIHSGVSERMQPQPAEQVREATLRLGLREPYFLFVGRNHPRKNLPMLRDAFLDARRSGLRALLVLAGPNHDPASAGDGIVILPYVSERDLPELYAGALALLLPSRFEGFGFPALEAMRCGTAVVAANSGALPEIVNGAGILLPAEDQAAWTTTMASIAQNDGMRRQLIAAGAAQSARFSWQAAARATWTVLDAAADSVQRRTTAS